MNSEQTNGTDQKGELVFRVCAYAMTGFQCTLYVMLISIPFIVFLFINISEQETKTFSSPTSLYIHAVINEIIYSIVPSLLGWFLSFLYPLKSKSQTWGMKLFGLRAVKTTESPLKWKTSLSQEGVMMITCSFFFIGLLGIIWALFDPEEKTVFNKISGVSIVQDQAKLKFVNEFREYRKNKV